MSRVKASPEVPAVVTSPARVPVARKGLSQCVQLRDGFTTDHNICSLFFLKKKVVCKNEKCYQPYRQKQVP